MNATRQKLFDSMKKAQAIERDLNKLFETYKKEQHKPLFNAFDKRCKDNLRRETNELHGYLNAACVAISNVTSCLKAFCLELNIKGGDDD